MFKQPTNAQEGLRQARVLERGREIARALSNGGVYLCYRLDKERFVIYKRIVDHIPDLPYIVDPVRQICSCPNFVEFAGSCKHLIGLQIHLDEREQEDALSAYVELVDNAEILAGVDYLL